MHKLDSEKAEEAEIKLPISMIWWFTEKARELKKKKIYFCLMIMLKPLTVWITTNWKILKEMSTPDHLTCLLRNLYLYAGQEATVITGHGITDYFKIGKGVHRGCTLPSAYLTHMQST